MGPAVRKARGSRDTAPASPLRGDSCTCAGSPLTCDKRKSSCGTSTSSRPRWTRYARAQISSRFSVRHRGFFSPSTFENPKRDRANRLREQATGCDRVRKEPFLEILFHGSFHFFEKFSPNIFFFFFFTKTNLARRSRVPRRRDSDPLASFVTPGRLEHPRKMRRHRRRHPAAHDPAPDRAAGRRGGRRRSRRRRLGECGGRLGRSRWAFV